MKKIKTELSELKKLRPLNLLALFLAGIVNAFGVTVFLAPVKLYDSGISGTAMLLSQVSGVSLSLFLIVLNLPLFLYGLKRQGRPLGNRTGTLSLPPDQRKALPRPFH